MKGMKRHYHTKVIKIVKELQLEAQRRELNALKTGDKEEQAFATGVEYAITLMKREFNVESGEL